MTAFPQYDVRRARLRCVDSCAWARKRCDRLGSGGARGGAVSRVGGDRGRTRGRGNGQRPRGAPSRTRRAHGRPAQGFSFLRGARRPTPRARVRAAARQGARLRCTPCTTVLVWRRGADCSRWTSCRPRDARWSSSGRQRKARPTATVLVTVAKRYLHGALDADAAVTIGDARGPRRG